MKDAVAYLETILKAATANKIWKREDPAQLLVYMQLLEELVTAAFEIEENCSRREDAIIAGDREAGPLVDAHYVSQYSTSTSWNCFPRSLKLKQYHNPYKAIKKFAKHSTLLQWKKFLNDCTEYALLKATITDSLPPGAVLSGRLHLLRLIEACHLLDVRTITSIQ